MDLDLDFYNRDVVISGEHFYTKTTCVNEVIRGTNELLHSENLVPKFDEIYSTLTLQIRGLKVRNTSDFSSGNHAKTSKSVRGKCTLAPSCGRGLSFFGNARLVQDIEVIVYAGEEERNQVLIIPVLKYESEKHDTLADERLQINLSLSNKSFEDFFEQATNNTPNLGVEIEINLNKNCGIYEEWDPTGDWSHNYVLKILTRQILIASKLDANVLPTIEGQIFDEFSLSWIDAATMEQHEEDEIDPWSIEYIQSRGSKKKVDELVNRDRASWLSRNWIWIALVVAALIGSLFNS